jgi:hypothetical protein
VGCVSTVSGAAVVGREVEEGADDVLMDEDCFVAPSLPLAPAAEGPGLATLACVPLVKCTWRAVSPVTVVLTRRAVFGDLRASDPSSIL